MRPQRSPQPDYTAGLTPPIVCDQPDDVESVAARRDYTLEVRFRDGLQGEVDLRRLIHAPDAGVFAELADPQRFVEAYVELGAVTWPGGVDLAPDAMYAEIRARGRWVP